MRILIVNWTEGENDPFSYFSAQFREGLQALGHEVFIVRLDEQIGAAIAALHQQDRVDLAFCWQGLGSGIRPIGMQQTIWELLEIPIICMHGDHPCYMPPNHAQLSAFHFHLYGTPAFTRDANRLIPRQWPAYLLDGPNFFTAPEREATFSGDFFVLPKNLTDLQEIRQAWQRACDPTTFQFLCDAADAIDWEFRHGNRRSHQEVIWDHLPEPLAGAMAAGISDPLASDLIFRIMRELDRVHRNVASTFIVDTLADVPLRVVGRGWDRFKARGNPHHQFLPFDTVAGGDLQFHSNYGILDVAPSCEALHDRCCRAIRWRTGFLISSSWQTGQPIHDEYVDLFFDGNPEVLRARIDAVRENPARHRARVVAFGEAFDARYTFAGFFDGILGLVQARALPGHAERLGQAS